MEVMVEELQVEFRGGYSLLFFEMIGTAIDINFRYLLARLQPEPFPDVMTRSRQVINSTHLGVASAPKSGSGEIIT